MRILKDNILRSSNNTVESGIEDESFPFKNIWDNRFVLQGKIDEQLVIDLGPNYSELSTINTIAISITSWNAGYLVLGLGNTTDADTVNIDITDIAISNDRINLKYLLPGNYQYRYIRITSYASNGGAIQGQLYINYLYLGKYLQLPLARAYEEPIIKNTDNYTTTVSGQIYNQVGYIYREVKQRFKLATKTDKDNFYTWYNTNDRVNNNIFIQFEDDIISYPPLFGSIVAKNENRFLGTKYYPFNITFTESK